MLLNMKNISLKPFGIRHVIYNICIKNEKIRINIDNLPKTSVFYLTYLKYAYIMIFNLSAFAVMKGSIL